MAVEEALAAVTIAEPEEPERATVLVLELAPRPAVPEQLADETLHAALLRYRGHCS